jgi:hypothetical protein
MMNFLFKPSLSYAQVANIVIVVDLANSGHWLAATIYLLVSSVIGGITETIVMERAT